MEDNYRNNVVDFSLIYLNKYYNENDFVEDELENKDFINYIFRQLFDTNINDDGYGFDSSTMQMSNNIGDLKIYNKDDPKKIDYLKEIKKGDLVFFHTKSLNDNSPTPNNNYPGHVGIYLGDNNFIHVSLTDDLIKVDKIDDEWLKILVASRDIIKGLRLNDKTNFL